MLKELINSVLESLKFFVLAPIFVVVMIFLMGVSVLHGLIHGGPIMNDDIWFLFKVFLCIGTPLVLTFLYILLNLRRSTAEVWFGQIVVLLLSAVVVFVGAVRFRFFAPYDHAPTFRVIQPYSVVNGRVVLNNEVGALRMDCDTISYGNEDIIEKYPRFAKTVDRQKSLCQAILACDGEADNFHPLQGKQSCATVRTSLETRTALSEAVDGVQRREQRLKDEALANEMAAERGGN